MRIFIGEVNFLIKKAASASNRSVLLAGGGGGHYLRGRGLIQSKLILFSLDSIRVDWQKP